MEDVVKGGFLTEGFMLSIDSMVIYLKSSIFLSDELTSRAELMREQISYARTVVRISEQWLINLLIEFEMEFRKYLKRCQNPEIVNWVKEGF